MYKLLAYKVDESLKQTARLLTRCVFRQWMATFYRKLFYFPYADLLKKFLSLYIYLIFIHT